jgi:hypothetical protein
VSRAKANQRFVKRNPLAANTPAKRDQAYAAELAELEPQAKSA